MAWRIEFTAAAAKQLTKLNRYDAASIVGRLEDIFALQDPRQRRHALVGPLAGLWRYRVGDWRLVTRIEDQRLVVLVVTIGHRREVYR